MRKTKIVATLGPASQSDETLHQLLVAGVDIVRLNFSHGDLDEKELQVSRVRRVAKAIDKPVAILQDLQGPKIRVGLIENGIVELQADSIVEIVSETTQVGNAALFAISFDDLASAVRPGNSIFLDDGLLELSVLSAVHGVVQARVIRGGALSSHKGVNLPGIPIDLPSSTAKDEADLRFGLMHGVDLVALSFVRSVSDAQRPRQIMTEIGKSAPLIAKIEKGEALDQLRPVLRTFDGAMVARGDLGVELLPEKVPAAQKRIIAAARGLGKPVITATQMLESMTHNPRPTRAEASDVANAVLDGTDAVMLSGETAVGDFPVETVRQMDKIIREAESIPFMASSPLVFEGSSDSEAVCRAAVTLAEELEVDALTALTRSGRTAQILSKMRPVSPILAFLWENESLARRLNLWRGVVPLVVHETPVRGETNQIIQRELLARGLVQPGSQVVVVGAAPGAAAGSTNLIRLLRL